MVSLYDVGCFLGAMSIGLLSDRCGRERSLSIASIVFIVGAVIQAASYVSVAGRSNPTGIIRVTPLTLPTRTYLPSPSAGLCSAGA